MGIARRATDWLFVASIDQEVITNKTAVKELSTATLSDWASRQTFRTNRHPENRLKIQ